MGIIIDLGIVAILALSIFLGYKGGLVKAAFKILSFIVALILAFMLCKPVSQFVIHNTDWDDNLKDTIQTAISAKEKEEATEEETQEEKDTSAVITDYIAEQFKSATAEKQNEIAVTVAENLTGAIINAMSFIGIFLIARLLLFFLRFLADALAEIPILKQFNKAGGLLYGILRGAFVIYLVFAIISLLGAILDISGLVHLIETSFIGKIVYDNNLLLKILF